MFYIGQKVVCVDDSQETGISVPLTEGKIYEITSIRRKGDAIGIQVYGVNIERQIGRNMIYEDHFAAERFRPIIENKTDISVFTEILDDVNKRAKESA